MNVFPRHAIAMLLAAACMCGAVVASPSDAFARPSRKQLREAEAHAKEAKEHFRNKRYEQAADLFMKVYRLSKKVTAVFNAARCKEMAGRLGEARSLFELYLSISDNEAGKEDAREHLVQIARRMEEERQAAEKQRAVAAEKARAAAEAKVKAELAAKQAQEARLAAEARAKELEQQKADAAARAKQAAEAAKKSAPKKLTGVVVLPPVGVKDGELAIAAASMLKIAAAEALAARIGKVRPVAEYNAAETAQGVSGACDFPCRLGVARNIGARWAIGITVRSKDGQHELQAVLWRTLDMAQDGMLKITADTAEHLRQDFEAAAGDLFNGVRIFPLAPFRPIRPIVHPPGQVAPAVVDVRSQPPGAALWVDAKPSGTAPRELQLTEGWHRLQLRLRGHRARGGLVYVKAGTHQRVTVVLPALPAPRPAPKTAAKPIAQPTAPGTRAPTAAAAPAGSHPPPAGARTAVDPRQPAGAIADPRASDPRGSDPRSDPRSRARRHRTDSSASPPARHRDDDRDSSGTVTLPGTGGLWGLALHASGSIAGFAARTPTEEGGADVTLGGGGFVHWGYATSTAPHVPWFSFMAGIKGNAYQGIYRDSSGAVKPSGPEVFAGVAFPRFWGLVFGVHRQWVGNNLSEDLHGFNLWSLGIVRTKEWIFTRLAWENRFSSDRPVGLDAFGEGPTGRLVLELGVNFGGVQFSR